MTDYLLTTAKAEIEANDAYHRHFFIEFYNEEGVFVLE
jgi:hypothetical protein